jgi:hypothetical protein
MKIAVQQNLSGSSDIGNISQVPRPYLLLLILSKQAGSGSVLSPFIKTIVSKVPNNSAFNENPAPITKPAYGAKIC